MSESGQGTERIKAFLSTISLGKPTAYNNMTVYPLFSEMVDEDGFVLLDDAVKTKKFVVTEVNEGGHVPELKVKNLLEIDVLILDGEQLIGAKQNRIVNTTIIIGKGKETVIPVSCVEQGRWDYKGRHFKTADRHLYADLRMKKSRAVSDNLAACMSFGSDQSEIWRDIRAKCARLDVESGTDAMQDIYERRENDLKGYESAFKVQDGQAGFIVLIDGKVVGGDIFGTKSVLPKVYAKLLSGYILDALDRAGTRRRPRSAEDAKGQAQEGETPASKKAVETFLKKVQATPGESFKSVGEGEDVRFRGGKVNGFGLVKDGKVVHVAAFSEN